jgi:hypothetical protein
VLQGVPAFKPNEIKACSRLIASSSVNARAALSFA